MKRIAVVAATVVGVLWGATPAVGQEALAEKSGCLTCHGVENKKVGPSFKSVAKAYKGKSEAAAFAEWKSKQPHSMVKASEGDVKATLKWVMSLQ